MSAPVPAVTFRALGKTFPDGPPVLRGIDFTTAPGEFVSIVGPSGCGKSTLLRLIAGLEAPSEGHLRFGTEKAMPRLAYIFQNATLLPWLTAQGNIETPLRLAGLSRTARAAKARQLAELVGLSEALTRYPRQLSGGMQMRVSLARALGTEPEILLLDEPFGALDAMTRNRLNEELLALHQRERWTAFFVTHSITEAVFLSNRVMMLAARPGRIADVFTVDLPFPRTAETRSSSAYQAAVAEASARLQKVLEVPAE